MPYDVRWTVEATAQYAGLRKKAEQSFEKRKRSGKRKSSKDEGLFKQVHKAVHLLSKNPKHPGLKTHEYSRIANPFDDSQKVWEAYAQNQTPGACRIFWCYGPDQGQITIIAITPHP